MIIGFQRKNRSAIDEVATGQRQEPVIGHYAFKRLIRLESRLIITTQIVAAYQCSLAVITKWAFKEQRACAQIFDVRKQIVTLAHLKEATASSSSAMR